MERGPAFRIKEYDYHSEAGWYRTKWMAGTATASHVGGWTPADVSDACFLVDDAIAATDGRGAPRRPGG